MFRFLRRYSKWILAVGGTLLLITFLIPYAFKGLGQMAASHGATWATIGPDDVKISAYDHSILQREKRIMEVLIPSLNVGQVHIDSVQHWYLLTHAAEEAGLIGGQQEALSMLGDKAGDVIAGIRAQTGDPPDFILGTVAKYRGVARLVTLFRSAGHFSDRRLRQQAKRLFHTAGAKFVVIPSDPEDATDEPTESEIKEQFETYADDLPGQGERGFGYKLPDRVKLEYLGIPADAVRAAVEASPEYNEIELRKHWRANPEAKFPEVTPGAPVPDIVKQDLAKQLFDKKMDEITREAVGYLRGATRGLVRAGAYYELPEDWASKRPQFPKLALDLQEKFGIPLPNYVGLGDRWLSAEDVGQFEGIGKATTDHFGPQPMPLPTIIGQLKEFGAAGDAIVQEGVAGPPLTGPDGSVYFFRVTATDPTRRATSVDEVRDKVVRDLKRLADYESLRATMTQYESEAQKDGLLALLVTDPRAQFFPEQIVSLASVQNLMLQAQLGFPLTAMSTPLPNVGRDEKATSIIIDRAMALPMLSVDQLTPEQKVFAVPVDDKLTLLIVEITRNLPLTREDFVQAVDSGVVQTLLLNQELDNGAAIADTFSYDALAKRYSFKLARILEDEDSTSTNDKGATPPKG